MTQIFQKLYCLPNHQIRKNTNFASFLFTGKNWDYYFTTKVSKNCEVLENVTLTDIYDEKKYIDSDYDNYQNFRTGEHLTFLQYA